MASDKNRAAAALAPLLSAFHRISNRPLRTVRQIYMEGSLERIVLNFDEISLVVGADENDDSIDVTAVDTVTLHDTGGVDGSGSEPWKDFIGKPFGWGWMTVNQQGYCDGLLLSFGGIVPQVVLNVIASSIKVATVSVAG